MTILLNTGDQLGATTAALQASTLTAWDDLGLRVTWGAGTVLGSSLMPVGWCWLEPCAYRLLVARSVLEEFALSNALAEFAEVITRVSEPAFRSFDVGAWRELDRLGF